MGRMYQVPIPFTAQTAQIDLCELTAGAEKPCVVHEIYVAQSTEAGDAQEEHLTLKLKRAYGSVTSGSGGTAPTPVPVNPDDAASGLAAEVNNTTKLVVGSGTIVDERVYGWNVRVPMQIIFTPETRPRIKGGEKKVLELTTTPADSITIGGYVLVEEL
ncbi:MAG: hypothetical protein IT529_06175 [Burkholderiales bacterium]|nr:hypothetical protein [Burkholderiales bacterium]